TEKKKRLIRFPSNNTAALTINDAGETDVCLVFVCVTRDLVLAVDRRKQEMLAHVQQGMLGDAGSPGRKLIRTGEHLQEMFVSASDTECVHLSNRPFGNPLYGWEEEGRTLDLEKQAAELNP
ncbi:hypothetical protein DNTS_002222, partial [Danionella cerebrum]